MSILIVVVVATYGTNKFNKMLDRADTSFQQSTERTYMNHTFEEMEFNFYFGVTDHLGQVAQDTTGYIDFDVIQSGRSANGGNDGLTFKQQILGTH